MKMEYMIRNVIFSHCCLLNALTPGTSSLKASVYYAGILLPLKIG